MAARIDSPDWSDNFAGQLARKEDVDSDGVVVIAVAYSKSLFSICYSHLHGHRYDNPHYHVQYQQSDKLRDYA